VGTWRGGSEGSPRFGWLPNPPDPPRPRAVSLDDGDPVGELAQVNPFPDGPGSYPGGCKSEPYFGVTYPNTRPVFLPFYAFLFKEVGTRRGGSEGSPRFGWLPSPPDPPRPQAVSLDDGNPVGELAQVNTSPDGPGSYPWGL
jgi:hypothetical protein